MEMTRVTASEFQKAFGALSDKALRENPRHDQAGLESGSAPRGSAMANPAPYKLDQQSAALPALPPLPIPPEFLQYHSHLLGRQQLWLPK